MTQPIEDRIAAVEEALAHLIEAVSLLSRHVSFTPATDEDSANLGTV